MIVLHIFAAQPQSISQILDHFKFKLDLLTNYYYCEVLSGLNQPPSSKTGRTARLRSSPSQYSAWSRQRRVEIRAYGVQAPKFTRMADVSLSIAMAKRSKHQPVGNVELSYKPYYGQANTCEDTLQSPALGNLSKPARTQSAVLIKPCLKVPTGALKTAPLLIYEGPESPVH